MDERTSGRRDRGVSSLLAVSALLAASLVGVLIGAPASAQPDTTAVLPVPADTAAGVALGRGQPPPSTVPPSTVLRRSLILPGWGQVTNRDYLKVPVVLAGVGGAVALAVVNHRRASLYRRAAIYADGETPATLDETPDPGNPNPELVDAWLEAGGFSANANRTLRDQSRRNRDFSVLLGALAYALQALDAYVSAHLADFDVSEDLSLRLAPTPTGAAASLRWQF